jgi:hypothetical protein
MKVFYHATMAVMEEAVEAFDTAYAASMRESRFLAQAS